MSSLEKEKFPATNDNQSNSRDYRLKYSMDKYVKIRGNKMAKNRVRQRANRKMKNNSNRPPEKHSFSGYKDLTAYNAIRKIESNGKSAIVLK